MWSNKYIGIPFKSNGRDYSGVDCWGLARLVYKEEYNIDLPSFEQDYIVQDNLRITELISQYKEGWQSLEEPVPGSIVLFRILGRATHVGVMINEREFLHSRQGYDVAIGSIFGTRWTNRIVGFYKYVDKTKTYLEQLPIALQAEQIPFVIDKPTKLVVAVDKLVELTSIEKENLVVLVNNTQIPNIYWESVELQNTDIISYRVVPGDGDSGQIFKMVALVVLAYYAPMIAAEIGLPGAAATTTFYPTGAVVSGFTTGAYAWGAAITIAGTYALNAIFPVRDSASRDPGSTEAQLMVEGSANRATPYSAIPVVLGKVRLTPPLAGQNYITYPEERVSYLTTALAWGFGPLTITDVKIGETPISEYIVKDSATITGSGDLTTTINKFNSLYARDVYQPAWSPQTLVCDGNPESSVTAPEFTNLPASTDTAYEVAVAFHMPQGMRKIKAKGDGAGDSTATSVTIETQYSLNNGSSWEAWETFEIGGDNPKKDAYTIVRTKTFSSEQSGLLVRVRRLTGDNTEDNPDYRYLFEVKVISITYTSSRSPITEPTGCTLARSVYVIQASDQLSGQMEGINAIVQSVCKIPGAGTAFGDVATVTSNPAALFLHVLTHPANPQKIEISEINDYVNMQQILYWYNYCDTQRQITFTDVNSSNQQITKSYKYEYNGVIADKRSVLDVLRDICAAGRASPTLIDGKWTVTIDEQKTAITQHFSAHNSWGFEAVRTLPKIPDGLKVTFYDEEQNYQQTETIVYNSGKTYQNSTLFESIDLPGVTNRGAVVDHAKWHFAQAKLRREAYSINCDIEYLSCNRGDRVKVTHDVPAWGGGSGRITQITQSTNIAIKTSESLYMDSSGTKAYSIRVRSNTAKSTVFGILNKLPFTGFTRSGNTITISLSQQYVPIIPFDSTDTISIQCSAFSGINLTDQKVTVDRINNTISYTLAVPVGNVGYNAAQGTINLTGEYEYLILNSVQSVINKNGNSESITLAQVSTDVLDVDNLFLFGEVNKESQDLIVLSIEPGENKTAKLTLVDYGVTDTYNIFNDYKNLTENTVFNTNITLPPKKLINSFTSYIVPIITSIYSNDSAVETLSPGNYRYNIKVSYATIAKQIPTNTKYVECQYYLAGNNLGDITDNIKSIYSEYNTNTITIPDVIVGQEYGIRLRYITSDGVTGPWPTTGWQMHTVVGFKKYLETVNSISVTRVGKYFRININSTISYNFKEYKIKIYKNNGNTYEDFWNNTDPEIKVITTANNSIDVNILEFNPPRISEAGTKYRIACRPVDTADNESQSGSALASITLTTIYP